MSIQRKKKVKEIRYLSVVFDDNMDTELFKLISMSSICRICESKQLCDVIGGIISLYSLMNGTVLQDENLQNSLIDEGFQLTAIEIKGKKDLSHSIKFVDSKLNTKFLLYLNSENVNNNNAPILIRRTSDIFKQRFSSLNFPVGSIIAYTGLCLCLMSKKLTKYNHFSWVRQKWKNFLGIVGLNQQFSECGPSHNLTPRLHVCRHVYSFFKLHLAFRRQLYLGIMKLSWESGMWGNICRAVLRFSKGLEINNIVLINTYVIQDHPELINVEDLQQEFHKLQNTFKAFRENNIPEEQWPYIQIMSHCPNEIWSKQNFPVLSYLAVQIGMRIRADLGGYYCEISSEMQKVADKIISEIFNFNSASQIAKAQPEVNVEASVSIKNNEFTELFEISDILEKSLHRISGVHSFNESDADLIVLPNTIPSTEIKIFKISNDIDNELHGIICMLNISRIYLDVCLTEVIAGLLSLFSAIGKEKSFSDECKPFMNQHGFELREISLESSSDLACHFVFENTQLNDLFLKFLKLDCHDASQALVIKNNSILNVIFQNLFMKTSKLPNIYAYIGMCFLPIFKQLDENNYASWFEHKWVTFLRLTDWDDDACFKLSKIPLPSQSTCCSIYSFFYSNFELRKTLFFQCYQQISSSTESSLIFLVICQNAKELEMNHIYLINFYILYHKRYLLKMKELRPELLRFMHSLEDMRRASPSGSGWLYFKLFCHPNEVEFLNKNNFPLLLYLAESFHDSKDKPKYAGVRTSTEYFKKVAETAKQVSKFYSSDSVEKLKFFNLNFPNGDLLSQLEEEQVKDFTINSLLLHTSHGHGLGVIPENEKLKIIGMSAKEVKEEYMTWLKYDSMFSSMPILRKLLSLSNDDNLQAKTSENDLRTSSGEDELHTLLSEVQIDSLENEMGSLDTLCINEFEAGGSMNSIEDDYIDWVERQY